jgi:hypothetical protein
MMKSFHGRGTERGGKLGFPATAGPRRAIFARWGGKPGPRLGGNAAFCLVFLAVCLATARPASAQVVPAGDAGGLVLTAGATASGYYVQYGERKLLGISAFIDADTKRRIGLEGEARWLEFHQIGNVHVETYAIGPRYHMNFGRFQPYAKGLVGIGKFNFPYNDAHGSYLVIAAGGGVDYRITRRLRLRLADCEYQYWPQFTFAPMTTFGVSSGLRIRVF